MPKRKSRSFTTKKRYKKKAKVQPRRAYAGSMVPLRTGGYNFNAPEVKAYDISTASYICDDNSPSITSICLPKQGTSLFTRVGTKIKITSIAIKGYVTLTAAYTRTGMVAASVNPTVAKLTVLIDYQANGTAPSGTTIFVNNNANTMLNLNNRDRFKVICEKTYSLGPYVVNTVNGYATIDNCIKPVKIYKKVQIPMFFNAGNAEAVSDVASNNILMVWQSDLPNGVGNTVTASLFTRCRFVDP